MLTILSIVKGPVPVTYTSAIQIKNVYSKNRLTVTSESKFGQFGELHIFSSRPPYQDGWIWAIQPDEDDINLVRTPIPCGAYVSFSSPITNSFISARNSSSKIEIEPTAHSQGTASLWKVICRDQKSDAKWMYNEQVNFFNLKYKCYLQTNLTSEIQENSNQYHVSCSSLNADSVWKAAEGIYFKEAEKIEENQNVFNEL